MAKKEIRRHGKKPASGMWRGSRLEGKVENRGIRPVKKPRRGQGR